MTVISLVFVLGINFLPSMQAINFEEIRGSKLFQYKLTNQGVGGLLLGVTGAVNNLACNELGPNFLPLILGKHRCSKESLAPDTFDSYENFCKCINSNPCLTSAVISIGIDIDGLGDLAQIVGKCCKNEVISRELDAGGQTGGDLLGIGFSRKPNDLLNGVVYEIGNTSGDLLCSFLGPKFLQTVLANNGCPSGVLIPYAFESKQSFCYHFKYKWSSFTRKCVSKAAIEILVDIPRIIGIEIDLGSCCADCTGKDPDNPPPRCKTTPSVIVPKC